MSSNRDRAARMGPAAKRVTVVRCVFPEPRARERRWCYPPLVFWLALAAVVVISLAFAAPRAAKPAGGVGLALVLAALIGVALTARFGPRALSLIAPTLVWSAWRWLRARAATDGAVPPFAAPLRRPPMTREEALRILGLGESATNAQIIAAHRSLIKKVHPDHGGSDHLAQQVNEAKRVLLAGPGGQ